MNTKIKGCEWNRETNMWSISCLTRNTLKLVKDMWHTITGPLHIRVKMWKCKSHSQIICLYKIGDSFQQFNKFKDQGMATVRTVHSTLMGMTSNSPIVQTQCSENACTWFHLSNSTVITLFYSLLTGICPRNSSLTEQHPPVSTENKKEKERNVQVKYTYIRFENKWVFWW